MGLPGRGPSGLRAGEGVEEAVGDELALNQRWETVNGLRLAVQALQRNHAALVAEVRARNAALAVMMQNRAVKVAKESGEGVIEDTIEFVFGQGASEDVEAARILEDNARAQYEKAVREEQELRDSLRSETAALNQATSEYAAALAAHANHLLEVAALRVHFKANLLYYMQAIWSHTFSDQLQLSVHRLEAPALPLAWASYTVERVAALPAQVVPKPGHLAFKVIADKSFLTAQDGADDVKTIAEIADPTPLGFFGNYMILRLKQSNPLTDFMMTPYVDAELGAHDPDELGNWTPEDFVAHVKALRATMPQPDFDQIMPTLDAQYRRIITAPRRAEEEIVVPSDSLYIEALPGTRPNLEDFKLRHRAADVNKVRAEVRRIELENLRYAGRILTHQFDDPEIDKQIRFEGNGAAVVVPPES